MIRGGETITIRRRSSSAVDEYGNPSYSTTNVVVKDVLIAVGGTTEPVDPARDAEDASLTLYLPTGTQVNSGDVFVIRNSEWVKDGSALEWISPFPATEAGVVVPVRKRRG